MPHKTECAEVIENLQNQILDSVISNALNDINTIANSSDNTNNTTSGDSDDGAPDNFVLYGLMPYLTISGLYKVQKYKSLEIHWGWFR
jgi:hypothetical protein